MPEVLEKELFPHRQIWPLTGCGAAAARLKCAGLDFKIIFAFKGFKFFLHLVTLRNPRRGTPP